MADDLQSDPRWRLAQSVAAGPHFARSPLLSKFLLYVVGETLAGRQAIISEHKIGVGVFGRPRAYRTDEDNIVRNYARQLRKRLAEHFTGIGRNEAVRIEVPIGGYVPAFHPNEHGNLTGDSIPSAGSPLAKQQLYLEDPPLTAAIPARRWIPRHGIFRAILMVAGLVAVSGGLWVCGHWPLMRSSSSSPLRSLWRAVLPENGTTYVVPSDAGFNLMEDMSHREFPLADYIRGSYDQVPATTLDSHTRQDLYSQRYTDFVSLQIIAMLARQPEYDPRRVLLRFPRDLRIDDLKTGNALIIGSANSNPWASLGDARTNFRIVPSHDMEGAAIVNAQPLAGEQSSYQSHWNEPSHETYALILFVPNLSGAGHLLVVEGLDVAGTEAAAEVLFRPELISPIVERAKRPDGSIRRFEILLRTNSIQSNAEGTQVIANRIR